jgi:hypothetical protein
MANQSGELDATITNFSRLAAYIAMHNFTDLFIILLMSLSEWREADCRHSGRRNNTNSRFGAVSSLMLLTLEVWTASWEVGT